MAQRQHIGGVARQVVALFTGNRLLIFRVILGKAATKVIHQRQIQTIQPNHRLIARVAVVVPAPLRGEDKVARMHLSAFTIDGGKCAFSFHDKAQRRLVMAMARSDFTWHN